MAVGLADAALPSPICTTPRRPCLGCLWQHSSVPCMLTDFSYLLHNVIGGLHMPGCPRRSQRPLSCPFSVPTSTAFPLGEDICLSRTSLSLPGVSGKGQSFQMTLFLPSPTSWCLIFMFLFLIGLISLFQVNFQPTW